MQGNQDKQDNQDTREQSVVQEQTVAPDASDVEQLQAGWYLRVIEEPHSSFVERQLTQKNRNLAEPDLIKYLNKALLELENDESAEIDCYSGWFRWFYVMKAYLGLYQSSDKEVAPPSVAPPPTPASSMSPSPAVSPRFATRHAARPQIDYLNKLHSALEHMSEDWYNITSAGIPVHSPCSDFASTRDTETYEEGRASLTTQSSPVISPLPTPAPTPATTPRKLRL